MIAAGTQVGHYLIRTQLGAGGMGEVYEAEDRKLLRTVAIKFIKRPEQAAVGAGQRFLREARMASQLNHPNIVTIYEIGETEEHTYIVMEYVRGRRLRDLIRAGSLTLASAFDAAVQIADALAEAHARGIIHRDIKPENILIDECGRVRLLDFGLAKALETEPQFSGAMATTAAADAALTDSGVVVGTIPYMSPEQIRKQLPLDEKTDVFSFGIVLYEMLCGVHPFHGENVFVVGAAILSDAPVQLDGLGAELPEGTAALLMRLLEKDRRRRAVSFAEIKRELEALKARLGRRGAVSDDGAHTMLLNYQRTEERPRTGPLSGASKSAQSWTHALAAPPTVLVLPFEAVGSSDEVTFIGIGMASVITTDLAKIGGLSVLSKAATDGAAGRGVRELAHALGANISLEGEVMRAAGQLRITARLIDVESGRAIWGEQYRGAETELFEIQDKVCEGVAAALKVSVSQEARDKLAHPATLNLDAFELYSKGRAFLERRDHEGNLDFAVQMFTEALRLDPEFALAYAGLGEAYWMKYEATRESQWIGRAQSASDRALVLDPNLPQVHISLGIIYHGTGAHDTAVEEFQCAAELQPLDDGAQRWLGRCYMQLNRMDLAEASFRKAVELRPGYWENYNWLGTYYYTVGRYSKAAEQYRRVIKIQPDNYQGYNNLGGMYYLLGRYADAVLMHTRAIEIHPAAKAYNNLGTDYFYLERYAEAIEAYRRAIELRPQDELPYRNLGDALLRVGREAEARAQYELACGMLSQALRVNPHDARLMGRMAVCQAKLRRDEEALASITQAAALEPRNTTLMYQRAVVHTLTGRHAEALGWLGQALSHGYSETEAGRDPDLDALRELDEYKRLMLAQAGPHTSAS